MSLLYSSHDQTKRAFFAHNTVLNKKVFLCDRKRRTTRGVACPRSVVDPGFLGRGAPTPKVGAPTYYLAKIFPKTA